MNKCPMCGSSQCQTEKVLAQHYAAPWDLYIVKCQDCFTRTPVSRSPASAFKRWQEGLITPVSRMLGQRLTPDEMDTTGAQKLVGAFLKDAGEAYRDAWKWFVRHREELRLYRRAERNRRFTDPSVMERLEGINGYYGRVRVTLSDTEDLLLSDLVGRMDGQSVIDTLRRQAEAEL